MDNVNIHRYDPPQWFRQADFGIFIHWGPSSVPAYAPVDVDNYAQLMREKPPEYMFKNIPYADWYLNSMRIEGSPVNLYHKEHYGNKPYTDFSEEFKQSANNVDVEKWADLFYDAGAKYVVVVSKHHDGFVLFNTNVTNPKKPGYNLDFDHVGNLAAACRKRGMRFGVYYSSLIDWTFTDKPIDSPGDLFLSNDNSKTYCDYCYAHWMEIVDRYKPDMLWCDIGYPTDSRLEDLFKYYYQVVPEGVVNDRWGQWPNYLRNPIGRGFINSAAKKMLKNNPGILLDTKYYDFRTLEYTAEWQENELYFEVCRGMDKSFAYNRFSRPQDYITAEEVREIIAEVVPKKGRLLLNVGPDSSGKIPEYQVDILKELRGKTE